MITNLYCRVIACYIRIVRMMGVKALRQVGQAFRTWERFAAKSLIGASHSEEVSKLRLELVEQSRRLHELTSCDDVIGSLAAEKCLNRY